MRVLMSVVVAALIWWAPHATAQTYPNKPIRLIVAFPPGGNVDTLMTNLPAVIGLIRENRLKGLAVTTLKRSSVMPNIPTFDESGLKDFEASTFIGVLAPAGTPPPVLNVLNTAILKAVRSPAIKDKFRDLGADPQETTPEQFSAIIRSDIAKWKKVLQAAGIKAE